MREFAVLVPTSVGPVSAIVTEPDVPSCGAVSILPARGWRPGPNQLWAKTAADLAEAGMTVLRMDYLRGANWQLRDLTPSVAEALSWFADHLERADIRLVGACLGARLAISVARNEPRVGALALVNPYLGELEPKAPITRLRRMVRRMPGVGLGVRERVVRLMSRMHDRYKRRVDTGAPPIVESLLNRIPIHVIVGEHDLRLVVVQRLQAELSTVSRGLNLQVVPGMALSSMSSLAVQEEVRRRVVSFAVSPDEFAFGERRRGSVL